MVDIASFAKLKGLSTIAHNLASVAIRDLVERLVHDGVNDRSHDLALNIEVLIRNAPLDIPVISTHILDCPTEGHTELKHEIYACCEQLVINGSQSASIFEVSLVDVEHVGRTIFNFLRFLGKLFVE